MCWSFRPRRLNLQIAILRLSNYLSILLQESQLFASDLQATREVLEDGRNAVLVTPSDADALADGINRVGICLPLTLG